MLAPVVAAAFSLPTGKPGRSSCRSTTQCRDLIDLHETGGSCLGGATNDLKTRYTTVAPRTRTGVSTTTQAAMTAAEVVRRTACQKRAAGSAGIDTQVPSTAVSPVLNDQISPTRCVVRVSVENGARGTIFRDRKLTASVSAAMGPRFTTSESISSSESSPKMLSEAVEAAMCSQSLTNTD